MSSLALPLQALGRAGRVHVDQEGAQTWIGGQAVTCMRGEVRL